MFTRSGALLLKRFGSYFFPTILMSVALSMSIVVDGIIVGNMLGQEALAAVNLGLPLMQAYAAIFVFIGMGGAVLASWRLGRHEIAAAGAVFSFSCLALLLCGIICASVGVFFIDPLSALLGGAGLVPLLRSYLAPLIWGAPLLIAAPGLSYFTRADGQPVLASAMLIVANMVNLVCDVLFIHWLGDISGAALATVTGYGAGMLLFGLYLASPRRVLRFIMRGNDLASLAAAILRAGLPGGLTIGLQFVKLLCLNMLVLSVAGSSGMVAFSVCLACLSLASMFISGASQTMMPIMGVLYGEGDYKGMRIVFRRALRVLLFCTFALIVLLMLFPGQLLALFGISGADALLGERAVRFYAPSLVGDAFAMLMIYYAQTIQRQMLAVLTTIIQNVAVLLPCAWLLSRLWGLNGIWLSFSITGAVTALFLLLYTRHISAKANLAGMLMLPADNAASPCLDVSIPNTLAAAAALSANVAESCLGHGLTAGTAAHAGLIVEEMAVNSVRYGGAKPGSSMLDVRLCIKNDALRITFRDAGRPFSPLEYKPENCCPAIGGIALLKAIGAKFEYSYALGFNNTVVVLPICQSRETGGGFAGVKA